MKNARIPLMCLLALSLVLSMGCGQDSQSEPVDAPPIQMREVPPGVVQTDARGLEWIVIPPGAFRMGCARGNRGCEWDEKPARPVSLSSYRIMKSEVTVSMYRRCIEAGACTLPRDKSINSQCNWGHGERELHPINCASWSQGEAFCTWAGGTLPSEAQWEYAARGPNNVVHPWGEKPPACALAIWGDGRREDGCGRDSTWPACARPDGNSPFGLCDMAGNVWEWVRDGYQDNFYKNGPEQDPVNTARLPFRVMRGGCWSSDKAAYLRASVRNYGEPTNRSIGNGFRCVSQVVSD